MTYWLKLDAGTRDTTLLEELDRREGQYGVEVQVRYLYPIESGPIGEWYWVTALSSAGWLESGGHGHDS